MLYFTNDNVFFFPLLILNVFSFLSRPDFTILRYSGSYTLHLILDFTCILNGAECGCHYYLSPFTFLCSVFAWGVVLPAIISDFISPWLPWNLTCVSRNDGRHQSASGSNFKRRGGRKISRVEIARVEITTCRQVVNPQYYEQNWLLCLVHIFAFAFEGAHYR